MNKYLKAALAGLLLGLWVVYLLWPIIDFTLGMTIDPRSFRIQIIVLIVCEIFVTIILAGNALYLLVSRDI